MQLLKSYALILLVIIFVTGCATANHGAFIANTYIDKNTDVQGEYIGRALGDSSQTWFLYLFPIGEAPSTQVAINNAKQNLPGTKYLSDMSIDDSDIWKIGYRVQTIKVVANAYK